MPISIVIPTYEQKGEGAKYLTNLLDSIKAQTFSGQFEVIVSDNATDGSIKQVCEKYPFVSYYFNPVRGSSENINNAISLAQYDKVKIMCQDDVMASHNCLQLFSNSLDKSKWVISNSVHIDATGRVTGRRVTRYIHGHFAENVTGMPSVIGFHKCELRFMPELKTVCDMFFYYQLYNLYGPPAVIHTASIGCRFHNSSLSRNQPNSHTKDINYLIRSKIIPGRLPKVVVAVVVYDRWDNIDYWLKHKGNNELVIIHNDNGDDWESRCALPGVTYIKRSNIGFDIGAFQDVCRNRLYGFPDYDYILWCVDDTVPMQENYADMFLDSFGKRIGIVCMQVSHEINAHVRTTGFMIHKQTAQRLRFPVDPVTSQLHCHQFEYKGLHLLKQIELMGMKAAQVTPLHKSPLYDTNYWQRNDNAKLLKHLLYREVHIPHTLPGMQQHEAATIP